jgi:hypothetical protein
MFRYEQLSRKIGGNKQNSRRYRLLMSKMVILVHVVNLPLNKWRGLFALTREGQGTMRNIKAGEI